MTRNNIVAGKKVSEIIVQQGAPANINWYFHDVSPAIRSKRAALAAMHSVVSATAERDEQLNKEDDLFFRIVKRGSRWFVQAGREGAK